ncbi:hypothetical protein [Chryseobacterium sp. SC28]|uniref:hypothetical protein n=1 Tax=Chryseobacterium sp. SC28 TaxID=2268028 RepID=UPI000F64AEF8|nr:hypothetical protein [Chryseobacterium sp. SC28]RRQ45006.1 hypothetical protein DTW91_12565 [Chryseobacterium sp. SC28]
MRKKLQLLFILFLGININGQGGIDAISALNKITPTSPNSTNFEKYGMNPVNLSAGVVSPSIPLISIPVGNNNFSVNLNYSTQGIKVDEFASIVGIGWSVNLGSITRNIRDLADEQGGTLKELPPLTGDNLFNVGNSLYQDLTLDSEYDVFNVNVDGLSTKFMLENDAQLNFTVKKLIKDDIKVEFVGIAADISNGNLNTPVLLVTSPNGTKYYFGGNGGVETSFTRPLNVGGIPPTMYTTAWMVSRIEYVNQKSIDFYYTQNQIIYNDGISQSSTIKFAVPDNTNSGLPQLLGANTSVTYNKNRMCVPDRIVSDGTTVKFNKSIFSNYISNYPNITSIELQYNKPVVHLGIK